MNGPCPRRINGARGATAVPNNLNSAGRAKAQSHRHHCEIPRKRKPQHRHVKGARRASSRTGVAAERSPGRSPAEIAARLPRVEICSVRSGNTQARPCLRSDHDTEHDPCRFKTLAIHPLHRVDTGQTGQGGPRSFFNTSKKSQPRSPIKHDTPSARCSSPNRGGGRRADGFWPACGGVQAAWVSRTTRSPTVADSAGGSGCARLDFVPASRRSMTSAAR